LFAVWVLSVILISFYGGTVSYGLFFAVSLILPVSFIYTLCVFFRFRLYQQIQSRNIICRQPVSYYFALQNEDFYGFASIRAVMFSSLSYVEDVPDNMEYELLPGDRYTYRTKLICKYRGEYEVGVREIIITDFFRLFQLKYKIPGTIKALVQPRVIYLEELRSISEIAAFVRKENDLAATEPDAVVRDYIAGDRMKYIHWKASAKEQKLKTRTVTGEEKQMLFLFFDTKRYGRDMTKYLPPENQVLETVLALGMFFTKRHLSFSLLQEQAGTDNRLINGLQDFEAYYKKIADTRFDSDIDERLLVNNALEQGMVNQCNMIIGVLQSVTKEMLPMFASVLERGVAVVLYVVTNDPIGELLKQGNERLRIIKVPIEADLSDVL